MATTFNVTVLSPFINVGIQSSLSIAEGATLSEFFAQYAPEAPLGQQQPFINGQPASWADSLSPGDFVTTAPSSQKNG